MPIESVSMVDAVLELAREQLGIVEATGKNDGLPSTRYMGGRQEPWCAHLIAWLFREVGAPLPGDVVPTPSRANPLAGVAHLERVCAEHGWQVSSPMRGDIIVFGSREESDKGPGMHIGIVEVATWPSATIGTIEGNSSDGVHRRTYRRAGLDSRVSSYQRRPEPEGWTYRPRPVRWPR